MAYTVDYLISTQANPLLRENDGTIDTTSVQV